METYHGYVRTPADAIKLFEACRLGLLPRVQRRLSEKERQSIRSGSVFVWDEREAGMRRWTDGKSWSASRVSGSFLTYREMEGKRGSGFGGSSTSSRRSNGRTPDGRLSDEDPDGEPEGYRYKADGLMKQSFSITTQQGQHLHLISYYSRPHPGAPDLPQPSSDPQLRQIVPAKGMYPESSLHDATPPALTRTPMQPYTNAAWMGPWPPSPSNTPPYLHSKLSPEVKPQPYPPLHPHQHPHARQMIISPMMHAGPHHHHQIPPPQLPPPTTSPGGQGPIYSKSATPYEGERLPPPTTRAYQPPPTTTSPHLQHLQQAAQAVMIDPRLAATSARNPQGPLPSMPQSARGITPPRTHSVFLLGLPARISNLSALLHPTPANSEPNSANPASSNSANSSPRAMTAGTTGPPGVKDMFNREDARALRSLDRKFCI
ncbi:Gti1/Pac2 family protein [Apiospora phragmitis]|uniref:Gti1/Pac2 family protein n=1 Tax=Apiospora phragmitis TaxID=2905665 RepID=A0ABR1SUW8_9PEZI